MNWKERIYEGLKEGRYGRGNPFSPKKSHVHGGVSKSWGRMSTYRDEDGKLWIIRKDEHGNEISRKPGKEIKKK